MEPLNPDQEQLHAQERQEGKDEEGNDGIQRQEAALGVEGRPEGEEPEAGDCDRPEGVGSEQAEGGVDEEEAEGRQLLNRQIVIVLKDGHALTCPVTIPWLDWMQQLFNAHGVLYAYGWIPIELIKYIAPAFEQDAEQALPDNVVPLFKR
jgi:hypothetical protein